MRMVDVRSNLEAHLGSRQVAKVVYGSIVGLALVVALQDHPPSAGAMIGWLVGTGVAVGLAELYSEIVGEETNTRHGRPAKRGVRRRSDGASWLELVNQSRSLWGRASGKRSRRARSRSSCR